MKEGAGHRLGGQGRHQARAGGGREEGSRGTAAHRKVEWTRGAPVNKEIFSKKARFLNGTTMIGIGLGLLA